MNEQDQKIMATVKNELSYAAHDFDHVMRVYHTYLSLAENEKGIDFEVLIPAILLHDIARSFMLAGKHGERLFIDNKLEDYIGENIGVNGIVKDLSKHSSNIEFELKLKKVPGKLYT